MNTAVKTTRPYRNSLREEQALVTRQRILDAARRLLVARGFGQVTMQEVARDAGVAYQTVYAQFGTKIRMAMAVCDGDLTHVGDALALVSNHKAADGPEALLRAVSRMARRLYEPCADVLRFMRESGDPDLVGRYKEIERSRLQFLRTLGPQLDRAPGDVGHASEVEIVDALWALTGPEAFAQLVLDRGWIPDAYERWLGDALVAVITPGRDRTRAGHSPKKRKRGR